MSDDGVMGDDNTRVWEPKGEAETVAPPRLSNRLLFALNAGRDVNEAENCGGYEFVSISSAQGFRWHVLSSIFITP